MVPKKECFREMYWLILADTTLPIDLTTVMTLVLDFQTEMFFI